MIQTDRKPYVSPYVQELGALKDITKNSGDQPSSDSQGGRDGTAYKPGS